MTDKEIISQLIAGNEACLKYLYRHLSMVKSWVRKNNGNDDDALDLFQEAIIVFYKNLMSGKYEHKSKISTYLFEISKRQWLNQLDRKVREQVMIKEPKSTFEAYESIGFEIHVSENALTDYLEKALTKLGSPCKSLIESAIFFKMRMEQIAKTFGYADAHSARQQKLQCLKRLRTFISYETVLLLK
jgi:RNA polymerase sigma factor (sigma-70 family)